VAIDVAEKCMVVMIRLEGSFQAFSGIAHAAPKLDPLVGGYVRDGLRMAPERQEALSEQGLFSVQNQPPVRVYADGRAKLGSTEPTIRRSCQHACEPSSRS
jgi:hypothetical protein